MAAGRQPDRRDTYILTVRGVFASAHPTKPYQAEARRGGKRANLGYFATAEEAELRIARHLPRARAHHNYSSK